jgi:hypothetical protein
MVEKIWQCRAAHIMVVRNERERIPMLWVFFFPHFIPSRDPACGMVPPTFSLG